MTRPYWHMLWFPRGGQGLHHGHTEIMDTALSMLRSALRMLNESCGKRYRSHLLVRQGAPPRVRFE